MKRLKAIQADIHQTFIDHVKSSRGDRLQSDDLFTGEIWVGQRAVDVGLADGIAHMEPLMKEKFGEDVKFINHAQKTSLAKRLGLGGELNLLGSVEERAQWGRFRVVIW